MTPSRFLDTPQVRALHGARVDELGAALSQGDPLADAVVLAFRELPPGEGWAQVRRGLEGRGAGATLHPAVGAFLEHAAATPAWVDWEVVDRAGALLLRAGPLGGLVLSLSSLPWGYASPAGNKPLALSGRLTEQAPRRLMETARFVHAVCVPGALHPGGDGAQVTLKVRLMHAQVRRLAWESGRWDAAAWGTPINQHDLVATTLLFSVVVLDGLRKLGLRVGPREAADYVHLWRYVGWLMGADAALLPSTEAGLLQVADLILVTQGAPDADSRALTAALLTFGLKSARTAWERRRVELTLPFSHAVAHHLLGHRMADGLGIPRASLGPVVPLLRRTLRVAETVRGLSSRAHRLAVARGDRAWRELIEEGLRGAPAEFHPPTRLARPPAA
ncbi:MAG: DUF2236 domain-containing protein [Myxococcus sp.]|nr:DUF2236 domain-containing protein [Myxococcus sp.]